MGVRALHELTLSAGSAITDLIHFDRGMDYLKNHYDWDSVLPQADGVWDLTGCDATTTSTIIMCKCWPKLVF